MTYMMPTADQSVELTQEAVKLGALNYLPKPFERQTVLGAVASVLQSQQTSRCVMIPVGSPATVAEVVTAGTESPDK